MAELRDCTDTHTKMLPEWRIEDLQNQAQKVLDTFNQMGEAEKAGKLYFLAELTIKTMKVAKKTEMEHW